MCTFPSNVLSNSSQSEQDCEIQNFSDIKDIKEWALRNPLKVNFVEKAQEAIMLRDAKELEKPCVSVCVGFEIRA